MLYLRAVRQAEEHKVLWSPILDGLSRSTRFRIGEATKAAQNTGVTLDSVPDVSVFLRHLAVWIDQQTDPERVSPLLRFKCDLLAEIVATRSVLSPTLLRGLLRRSPTLGPVAARNGRLDGPSSDWLSEWAYKRLFDGGDAKRILSYGQTLAALQERGVPALSRSRVSRLVRAVQASPPQRGHFGTPGHRQVDTLLRVPDALERKDIAALLPCVSFSGDMLVGLLASPSADPELVHHALTLSGSPKLRLEVVDHPRWNLDPRIRKILIRSTAAAVLTTLLHSASDRQESLRIFRALSKHRPRSALEILRTNARLRASLGVDGLGFLLQSANREVRTDAMTILPTVIQSSPEHSACPSPQDSHDMK